MRSACLLLLLLAASPAVAQTPFDMSGDKPAVAPVPQSATPPSMQSGTPPAVTPPVSSTPLGATLPAASNPAPVEPTAAAEPSRRYLVPFTELVLAGEYAQRSWSVFLTPEQAAAASELHLGYQNAIVVAPESSRMAVSINGIAVVDEPIAASDNPADIVATVPPKVLHAGLNDIVISAVQRHRTDCSIQSTYELWTQIDLARTFLAFEGVDAGRWKRVEDLRAIGVDESGATTFNLIVPSMAQAVSTPSTVRLGEALALMANMPNQAFEVSEDDSPEAGPGVANVVLGPAADVAKVLSALPQGAEAGPVATVVDDPKLGPSTLVISGPTWQAVDMAIDDIAKQVDRPVGSLRTSLGTRNWRTPDVPMLQGANNLKFSDLGVSTLEFSGRRVRADFAVGVPADFYARSYGQATILLDAAYSQDVLPGSHIDIYVNDNIAATVPITTAGGEILRHLPIKVTMRHFRPGDNNIAIEAVLLTQADAVCAPGATASGGQRFVVFDTSEFVMPDFARVARTPDLAAISGTGFPYSRVDYPLPLIMDRAQSETVSAGVTLLARMSVAAGRLIPVDASTAPTAVAERNAVFLSSLSQVPPTVLAQVGVSANSSSGWGEAVASIKPSTDATFDEWRQKLRGSGWRGQIGSFEDWMTRTFNISTDSFSIFPGRPAEYTPQGSASLLVAQEASPTAGGTWTLITAPSAAALREGVRTLTQQRTWRQLGGHLTTVDSADDKVVTLPVTHFSFIETQPFSLANYRLIVANWLSANALSYAVVLTVLSILLGFATAGLLRSLGRRR
ncbi:cellulose biosynthesis cyclic di-GMP-binding regulatory protein BcsB [Mesorhizobium sp. CU2]|uniref:cellulose biosynthesis cyclic di-GMP-binding regulatory protein BcsB n=1 Tax=unclassified Mesorhizobium TaxID=325217 RepID=UPI00112D7E32|nr:MULTISPECIES: cellulose biosynthesis cyclic di-GMP-binding regulatory protein BcsB [unclassified Mesorhizobium]TPN81821.1 cellulose biosynthesis cyclic di-GMP-binding regulatory protein BcsB [Mesorhizobium sp. CU3]TPO07116.1 cellulose biosynthesis cyclic di-GMP-binding regulatory protein BcsB [Mesorhizobium sp. CU2]